MLLAPCSGKTDCLRFYVEYTVPGPQKYCSKYSERSTWRRGIGTEEHAYAGVLGLVDVILWSNAEIVPSKREDDVRQTLS